MHQQGINLILDDKLMELHNFCNGRFQKIIKRYRYTRMPMQPAQTLDVRIYKVNQRPIKVEQNCFHHFYFCVWK